MKRSELKTIIRLVKQEIIKEDYSWEIQRGKEWDAFEQARQVFGDETLLSQIAKAMGTDDLGTTLAFIFRNNDFTDSLYLKEQL